jgi:1-hydroxycarotenoid 3,4-desaturase
MGRLRALWQIRPFSTLWHVLGEHFSDPRLRQLFGRYATYCGSSPFAAPATLMLIAHVEQSGVWVVDGGMHRVAGAIAAAAAARGARFRYGTSATDILVARGRVSGVRLASGEVVAADAVVANADVAAIAAGRLGEAVACTVPPVPRAARSLSAVTWTLLAKTQGFALHRHNVFFSRDYQAEFDDLFRRRRLPGAPTVYVCAQDRGEDSAVPWGTERLLCLVNAPACGDDAAIHPAEIARCEQSTFDLLTRCGLQIQRDPGSSTLTTPADFERLFPGTGGALYGRVNHGWSGSFRRPSTKSAIAGLYFAGGSTHPGPGVPMAALSGQMAATTLLRDFASTSLSRMVAMSGGMSMR